MNKKLIAGLILATGSLFAAPRIAVGVGFGAPAPVAPVYATRGYAERAYVPPCPGPDYVWTGGRWVHRPSIERRERFDRHRDHRDFDRR